MDFSKYSRVSSPVAAASLMALVGCGGSSSTVGCSACPPVNTEVLYVGEPGQIQVFPINPNTGALASPATISVSGPGGMVSTPDSKFMYVTDPKNNQLDAFTIDSSTGNLTPLSGSPFPLNSATQTALFASIDPAGKFLYVSDLYASDVLAFSIDGTTGSITLVTGSPFNSGFYPAKVIVSPSNFAEVLDIGPGLGGISSFAMNPANGVLNPGVSGPLTYVSSAGAADMVMHSSGMYLFISQGMTSTDSGVAAFTLDQTSGFPTPFPGPAFPTGLAPRSMVSDSKTKFLYTANTGDGTISAFTINSATGVLSKVPGSPFSANITPPPGGLILFQLAIDPSGNFLYVTNPQKQSILIFGISSTGTLTALGNTHLAAQPGTLLTLALP